MATNALLPSTIPEEWETWISENKMQDLGDEKIVQILVANGLDEPLARDAVRRFDPYDPSQRAGRRLAQRLQKLESVLNSLQAMASLDPTFGCVPRVKELTREEFLRCYYSANRPVVITDVMKRWSAPTRWTPEYLKSKCGHVIVEVMTGRDVDPAYEINMEQHKNKMLFGDFVDRVFSGECTNDCYMTGNNHFLENPEVQCLLDDIEVCSQYLEPEVPGFSFFWFGPGGTVTKPHHDELNILMAQVLGQKKITLVSPSESHLVYNNLGVYSDVDWDVPDYDSYPLFKKVHRIEVTLNPGEMLFIPVGWWHYVKGVKPSLTISFSNFVFPNEFQYRDPEIRD